MYVSSMVQFFTACKDLPAALTKTDNISRVTSQILPQFTTFPPSLYMLYKQQHYNSIMSCSLQTAKCSLHAVNQETKLKKYKFKYTSTCNGIPCFSMTPLIFINKLSINCQSNLRNPPPGQTRKQIWTSVVYDQIFNQLFNDHCVFVCDYCICICIHTSWILIKHWIFITTPGKLAAACMQAWCHTRVKGKESTSSHVNMVCDWLSGGKQDVGCWPAGIIT